MLFLGFEEILGHDEKEFEVFVYVHGLDEADVVEYADVA